mgnify:CR=1 FL=1
MPNEAHIIALAGNPNVGKSTVFNALTGLRQHTGNWPGKTVAAARGDLTYGGEHFTLVDLPGTYSLFPNSAEEEIARDYLCSGEAEAVLILADATCLERSLNLVLQTLEAADIPAVVCVNLLDEAAKKGIVLDLPALSRALGVPVVGTAASCGEGLDKLRAALAAAHDIISYHALFAEKGNDYFALCASTQYHSLFSISNAPNCTGKALT